LLSHEDLNGMSAAPPPTPPSQPAVVAAWAIPCAVANENRVRGMVHETAHRSGRLDVYVNNAGVTRDATTPNMSLEQFRSVIDIHLQGAPRDPRSV